MKTIVGFSLESYSAGDKVWGRPASTPAFFYAMDWAAGQFKSAVIADKKVERFPITTPMWSPKSWRVQLNGDDAFGPGSRDVVLSSAFPQPGGASMPEDRSPHRLFSQAMEPMPISRGRDVKGKIVVIHVRPEPSLFGSAEQGAAARVVAHGAIAVTHAVEGEGNSGLLSHRIASRARVTRRLDKLTSTGEGVHQR